MLTRPTSDGSKRWAGGEAVAFSSSDSRKLKHKTTRPQVRRKYRRVPIGRGWLAFVFAAILDLLAEQKMDSIAPRPWSCSIKP